MWVWQSHAPPGTAKFTAVCGCEALARAKRGAKAAATPLRRSSRLFMMVPSELVTPQPAVDRDYRTGDVPRPRRSEKGDEIGQIFRLAVFANRDVVLALMLAELGRIVAQDL